MTAIRTAIALAAALGAALAPALAQDDPAGETPPRVQALRIGEVVAISGSYLETSSCESFEGIRPGMPEGAVAIAGALAATLAVRHSGADFCALVVTERPYFLAMPGAGASSVALFVERTVTGGQRRVDLRMVPINQP